MLNNNIPRGDASYRYWDEDYDKFVCSQTEWKSSIVTQVENHLNAKMNGELLHEKTDFYDWYSSIRDDNYSVIVKVGERPLYITINNPMYLFMNDYGIEKSCNTYIGAWVGEKSIVSTYDEKI